MSIDPITDEKFLRKTNQGLKTLGYLSDKISEFEIMETTVLKVLASYIYSREIGRASNVSSDTELLDFCGMKLAARSYTLWSDISAP